MGRRISIAWPGEMGLWGPMGPTGPGNGVVQEVHFAALCVAPRLVRSGPDHMRFMGIKLIRSSPQYQGYQKWRSKSFEPIRIGSFYVVKTCSESCEVNICHLSPEDWP